MNDQPKQDINNEVVEEAVVEAVVEAPVEKQTIEQVSEDKPVLEEVSSKKTIKDYLSKDLFAGIKVISGKEDQVEVEKLTDDILEEYQSTFNDISENQIISAKVIGISDNDVMVDIGFKSEGIIDRSDEIINICISEAGKTRPDAEAELDRAIQALTHTAGVQHFYPSIMSPNVAGGIDITDVRYPIGVVVGCGPFNFPILIPILHASMAIVTGNTFIAKPSEKVPSISRLISAGFTFGL